MNFVHGSCLLVTRVGTRFGAHVWEEVRNWIFSLRRTIQKSLGIHNQLPRRVLLRNLLPVYASVIFVDSSFILPFVDSIPIQQRVTALAAERKESMPWASTCFTSLLLFIFSVEFTSQELIESAKIESIGRNPGVLFRKGCWYLWRVPARVRMEMIFFRANKKT